MIAMKLLTLNTHSLEEPGYVEKTEKFIEMLVKEQPDIVALQEVNQSQNAAELPDVMLDGYTRCGGFELAVRADNHAAYVVKELRKRGIYYDWTWISAKTGYGKYDEGMALLSRKPITRVQQFLISKTDDYENWKTRRTLGIQPEGSSDWFFTVHMGWWNDGEEPFADQWKCIQEALKDPEYGEGIIWLMGDFNSQADVRGEGYDLVLKSGWKDTYLLAEEKDDGITVAEEIDGWREEDGRSGSTKNEKRLDYIFCNTPADVRSSNVICNGKNAPVVSDHYGVMITV